MESKIRKMAEIDHDLGVLMDDLKTTSGEIKPQIDEYWQNKKEAHGVYSPA